MIPNLHSGETYIDRLRVHGVGVDPIRARLQLSSLLNTGFPQARIAPSAIVFLRKLRDPLPGVLRLDAGGGYLPERWNDALAESFHKLVRNAVRPAVSPVSGSEEAIIFLDRSELLACLATDLCQGTIAARWWWRGLLKGGSFSHLVRQLWRDRPEYVPAALAYLARKEKAADFVKLWSHTESLALLQEVIKSFALHELLPVVAFVQNGNVAAEPPIRSTSPPSWKRWVPESDAPGLEVGQQLLLSICLLLRRVPATVRSSDFALEIRNWYQHASATPASQIEEHRTTREDQPTASSPVIARPEDKVDSAVDGLRISAHDLDKDSNAPELSLQSSTMALTSPQTTQPSDSENAESPPSLPGIEDYVAGKPAETKPTEIVVSSQPTQIKKSGNTTSEIKGSNNPTSPIKESSNQSFVDQQPNNLIEGRTVNEEVELRVASDTAIDTSVTNREQIETQFGGLFYLINLGLYLNLYGDFTTPAKPGIELNIWDFVALVGEELIGSNDDPIWPFFAHLAGREPDQAPGERFAPDDSWRVAPEWLTHFSSSGSWTWSSSDDRLRLLHPEGFLVLDVPLDTREPARQLRAEIEKYESDLPGAINLKLSEAAIVNTDSETVTRNASPEVRAWLAWLMPYVRARLCAALDVGTEDLATLICRRPARVDATDTHLEVFFGLADLPLEIRLAGLDRDPGWVPAAGRFIAFHFD